MFTKHVGWGCRPPCAPQERRSPEGLRPRPPVPPADGPLCSSLFPQGGVKVLITGPWQEASNNYSCLFDQISVPASLIQPGVLRCYCPGEEAAPPPRQGPMQGPSGSDTGQVMAPLWASVSSAVMKGSQIH